MLDERGGYLTRQLQKMGPGNFVFDSKSSLVRVSWHFPTVATDTLTVRVRVFSGGIGGDVKMGEDPIRMELARKLCGDFWRFQRDGRAFSEGKMAAARRKFLKICIQKN